MLSDSVSLLKTAMPLATDYNGYGQFEKGTNTVVRTFGKIIKSNKSIRSADHNVSGQLSHGKT